MTWLVVPLYAASQGLSNAQIGVLFSLPVLVQAALNLLGGAYTDRVGGRRIMLASCWVMAVAALWFMLAKGFWMLLAGQVGLILARAAFWPATWAMASELTGNRGVELGRLNAVTNVGQIAGAGLCGVLLSPSAGALRLWRRHLRPTPRAAGSRRHRGGTHCGPVRAHGSRYPVAGPVRSRRGRRCRFAARGEPLGADRAVDAGRGLRLGRYDALLPDHHRGGEPARGARGRAGARRHGLERVASFHAAPDGAPSRPLRHCGSLLPPGRPCTDLRPSYRLDAALGIQASLNIPGSSEWRSRRR